MLFSVLSIRLRVEIGRRLLHSDVCGTVSNVSVLKEIPSYGNYYSSNTFAASYLNTQGLNNSCLKSPASTLVDLTFQSRALRSFSLNQLRNLSL